MIKSLAITGIITISEGTAPNNNIFLSFSWTIAEIGVSIGVSIQKGLVVKIVFQHQFLTVFHFTT